MYPVNMGLRGRPLESVCTGC